MIGLASVIAGAVLLLLLALAALTGLLASKPPELQLAASEEDVTEPCPEAFLNNVFSRADCEFVRRLKARSVEHLFEQERKKVALVWVRHISAVVRRVMRQHVQAARQSRNLKFSTEINILAQFLALMGVCGILWVAIQIAGPLWLGGLAYFAQKLSQRVSELQESFRERAFAKAGVAGSA
jgi:hypothetical protein